MVAMSLRWFIRIDSRGKSEVSGGGRLAGGRIHNLDEGANQWSACLQMSHSYSQRSNAVESSLKPRKPLDLALGTVVSTPFAAKHWRKDRGGKLLCGDAVQ